MSAISHKGTIDPISAAFFIIKTCYATSDVRRYSPNITGKFRFENGYGSADTCGNAIEVEGAFFNSDPVDKKIFQANENWRSSNKLNFSAANSNAIYNASTVQPASLQLMPCIRT